MSESIEKTIDISRILKSKMGTKAKFVPSFLVSWLKKTVHEDEVNRFLWESRHLQGTEWLTECVKYLKMNIQLEGVENLPDKKVKEAKETKASLKPQDSQDSDDTKEPAEEEEHEESLKEAIAKQAIEDEAPLSSSFTLRKILGGDILTAQVIRRQIWLIVLVVFFIIIYISNRYSIQQDMIEIDQLQEELQNAKYKALSSSSQITERSRESNVLKMLQNNKDSVLHIATQPPYIINVPENE